MTFHSFLHLSYPSLPPHLGYSCSLSKDSLLLPNKAATPLNKAVTLSRAAILPNKVATRSKVVTRNKAATA